MESSVGTIETPKVVTDRTMNSDIIVSVLLGLALSYVVWKLFICDKCVIVEHGDIGMDAPVGAKCIGQCGFL